MDELESLNPFYRPFFDWVRQQGQDVQTTVEADVQLLLPVFDASPSARQVFLRGRDAALRLQRTALDAGYQESADVFQEDYEFCCYMLGMRP